MKSYLHSRVHAKKYGGIPEDYVDIDDFIDSSKQVVADVRHRAILHSAFGCFIVEQVFGRTRVNSDGKTYSPRDIAEDHIIQDLGFIPSMEKYLNCMSLEPWMSGSKNNKFEQTLSTIGDTIKPMVAQNEKLLETNDKLNKMLHDREVSHLERIAIGVERIAHLQEYT